MGGDASCHDLEGEINRDPTRGRSPRETHRAARGANATRYIVKRGTGNRNFGKRPRAAAQTQVN